MNILLSVFECDPQKGSDSYVGWSYVMNAAKKNEVYALTRSDNRSSIEQYCIKNGIVLTNIHFIYVEQSVLFTKMLYKLNRYLGFLGSYFVWQKSAYKKAKKLCKTVSIDVSHHVTIADFRCAGYLWKLNVPFVMGPIGGAGDS